MIKNLCRGVSGSTQELRAGEGKRGTASFCFFCLWKRSRRPFFTFNRPWKRWPSRLKFRKTLFSVDSDYLKARPVSCSYYRKTSATRECAGHEAAPSTPLAALCGGQPGACAAGTNSTDSILMLYFSKKKCDFKMEKDTIQILTN